MGDNPIENVLGLLYGRVGKIEKEENVKKKKYLKIRHETESERDKFGKKYLKILLEARKRNQYWGALSTKCKVGKRKIWRRSLNKILLKARQSPYN